MDAALMELHRKASIASGEQAACGKKVKHADEAAAANAADSLNRSGKARHEVEPYPCRWCSTWHIGRVMPTEELEASVAQW